MSEQVVSDEITPNNITFEQARGILSATQGKILTIIDATHADHDSRTKYIKDLVRDAFSQQGNWLFDLATGGLRRSRRHRIINPST